MVTTKQKPKIKAKKKKRLQPKDNTKENQQITKEGTKRRSTPKNQKTSNKMAINTYL